MNIWIENPFDNLLIEGYRPHRYWMMAKAFVAAGHDVTYFTSDFSHANKRHRVFLEKTDDWGFKLLVMSTLPYRRNVSLARIRSHREYGRTFGVFAESELAAGNHPDVLIVSMPPLSTCDVALAIKAKTGCRLVFDVQDAWPETFERLFPAGTKGLGRFLLSPLRRTACRAYRAADLVTGVTERYEEMVLRAGANTYRTFPLGIEYPQGSSVPKTCNPLSLVYVGNMGQGYDLGTVIRAVVSIPEATLDVAGAGEREDEWKRLAADNARIRFHGYLQQDALMQLLSDCSIGVIPMRDDSFVGVPNKLADYASQGLKTVTSLQGECAKILEIHQLGATYEVGDVPSLIAAIRKTMDLRPDFESVRDRFDSARIYPDYVRFVTRQGLA